MTAQECTIRTPLFRQAAEEQSPAIKGSRWLSGEQRVAEPERNDTLRAQRTPLGHTMIECRVIPQDSSISAPRSTCYSRCQGFAQTIFTKALASEGHSFRIVFAGQKSDGCMYHQSLLVLYCTVINHYSFIESGNSASFQSNPDVHPGPGEK